MDRLDKDRWHDDYKRARKEYDEAEAHYRNVEANMAAATARRNKAERELSRLFAQRMNDADKR